jgi:hypothetical protein
MNAYRVKEIMWGVIILMFFLIFVLSGCSSAPHKQVNEQFCDLRSQTDVSYDNAGRIINQRTKDVMVCSDNQIEKVAIKKAGIAQNCGEYVYYVTIGGNMVEQRGIACKKFNGAWEVISR